MTASNSTAPAPTSADTPAVGLRTVNSLDHEGFVALLGSVFEHSPWVAERAAAARPFAGVDALHQAMIAVVEGLPTDERIAFLCAHPELAGKEAQSGSMTSDSTTEQASAGLDALSPAELEQITRMNAEYRQRHGFPFIICVPRYTKQEILDEFRRRTAEDTEAELAEAVRQITVITGRRLQAVVRDGARS
ncbi:2-oxo-4-hydroxy-4-carboxy-5-ureidoimidazoline decarboxylase [Streptomyces cavernicola]|uniref:2-oxo-4-hydroxy-4-carboxy-5-ureidoimidazoline decarboxylase n=1 Tax=Streptomyces cavernicola TaxID=3043613 RepID=A0ABT6S7W0_9ACTN|nr:2-oxo-4-hydroxy-4-carboxy-5-ureidoimidazoline decarboxylase [Streptomyces sp. B-S-A6]MDI3404193.1 2-oxo-4-hydroxy-4-carboxy-5-ureidoimidazoline decarboxylase [Streptomyces sp. B-S-A6]